MSWPEWCPCFRSAGGIDWACGEAAKALCTADIEFGPIDPRLPLLAFADVYLQTFDTTGRIVNDRPYDIAVKTGMRNAKGYGQVVQHHQGVRFHLAG